MEEVTIVAVGASVPLPRAVVVRELDGACVLLGLIDSLAAHYARREVRRAARETLIRTIEAEGSPPPSRSSP